MLASKQRIAYMADPAIPAVLASDAGVRSRSRFLRFEIPEIWMRFLLALLGLILAFAAAVFSTVARESGSLWATVILASIALVLAVVVGLTTVPYLARRVAGSRVRDAFKYDVTGVGIVYVVSVLLIGVAALNTGNNLLYVIVASMLAAILVSGVASAIVLIDGALHRLAGFVVLDVAPNQEAAAPLGLDAAAGLGGVVVLVEIGDGDVGALAREQHRDRAADARIGAGDQCREAFELAAAAIVRREETRSRDRARTRGRAWHVLRRQLLRLLARPGS